MDGYRGEEALSPSLYPIQIPNFPNNLGFQKSQDAVGLQLGISWDLQMKNPNFPSVWDFPKTPIICQIPLEGTPRLSGLITRKPIPFSMALARRRDRLSTSNVTQEGRRDLWHITSAGSTVDFPA